MQIASVPELFTDLILRNTITPAFFPPLRIGTTSPDDVHHGLGLLYIDAACHARAPHELPFEETARNHCAYLRVFHIKITTSTVRDWLSYLLFHLSLRSPPLPADSPLKNPGEIALCD